MPQQRKKLGKELNRYKRLFEFWYVDENRSMGEVQRLFHELLNVSLSANEWIALRNRWDVNKAVDSAFPCGQLPLTPGGSSISNSLAFGEALPAKSFEHQSTSTTCFGDPTLLTVSGSQYNTAPFLKSSELDSLQLSSYSTTLGGLGLMTPWLSNETPLQSWLSSPQRSHSYPLDGTTMQISGPISPYSSEQSQSIQAEPTSADLTIKQRSYVRQASGPEHGSNLMFRSQ